MANFLSGERRGARRASGGKADEGLSTGRGQLGPIDDHGLGLFFTLCVII